MVLSGSLSVVCNVTSGWFGGGIGPAGYGAFVVFMFLLLEWAVVRIKPAAAVTRARNAGGVETQAPSLTPRQVAARKGAATRARKAAAPVSPGMAPVPAPSVSALEAIAQ
jgi:hypothetical protein